MSNQTPDIKEKTGAVAAYLTLGIWGFIWLLISRRHYYDQKDFVRFHCFQSIFIGILYMFIPQGVEILFTLLMQIANLFHLYFLIDPLNLILSISKKIIHFGSLVLILYCVII